MEHGGAGDLVGSAALRTAVCTIVRDEQYDIAEWLAHHIALGFDSIVVIDNGSSDNTLGVVEAFSRSYDIRVLKWSSNDKGYQVAAYLHAVNHFKDAFDWILFIDADEFLILKEGRVDSWLGVFRSNVSQVLVNWVTFGSSGHEVRPSGFVLDDFVFRAPDDEDGHVHTKSFVRPVCVRGCGNPHWFEVVGRTVNTFGEDVNWPVDEFPQTHQTPTRTRARIHHYWTKSREQWIQKNTRGYPGVPSHRIGVFDDFNSRAIVRDVCATSYLPKIKDIISNVLQEIGAEFDQSVKAFFDERYELSSESDESGTMASAKVRETRPAFQYNFSIVACARWESRYIVEWLNYYKAIGFDHVYLYCNDDEPFELYEKILPYLSGETPYVTFKFWPEVGAQFDMYFDFLMNYKHETRYVSFLDIDEFLRISNFRTISDFVDDLDDHVFQGFDSVYFNWCMFGNSGYEDRPEGAVLSTYTRRETSFSNFMTKHLTKTSSIDTNKIHKGPMTDFWHYWDGADNFGDLQIVNIFGEDVGSYYSDIQNTMRKIESKNYVDASIGKAVVNHYAFKSKRDFLLRVQRGIRGVFAQQIDYEKAYHDGRADQMLTRLNEVEDTFLCERWHAFVREGCSRLVGIPLPVEGPGRAPISCGKPATQSSLSEWSNPVVGDREALDAVNGIKDGSAKFHTALEEAPWWQVDLLDEFGIDEIRVFNRMGDFDITRRSSRLAIDVGLDRSHLMEVYRREDEEPFGGVDGNPLVFKPSIPIPGRFVRVRLLTMNYLHLDQVEVYGEPLAPFFAKAVAAMAGEQ